MSQVPPKPKMFIKFNSAFSKLGQINRLEAILWLRTSEILSFENLRFWLHLFTCIFTNVLAIHRLGEVTKSTGNLGMYFSGGLPRRQKILIRKEVVHTSVKTSGTFFNPKLKSEFHRKRLLDEYVIWKLQWYWQKVNSHTVRSLWPKNPSAFFRLRNSKKRQKTVTASESQIHARKTVQTKGDFYK